MSTDQASNGRPVGPPATAGLIMFAPVFAYTFTGAAGRGVVVDVVVALVVDDVFASR